MTVVLPMRRQWRTVILDGNQASPSYFGVLTILDGLAMNRAITRKLREPWEYSCTVPSDDPEVNIPHTDGDPFVEEGTRYLIALRYEGGGGTVWQPRWGGILLQIDDHVDDDVAHSDLTAFDPRIWLTARPIVDGSGNLPDNPGVTYTATPGSTIAAQLLANTIAAHGSCLIDAGPDYGGTTFWGGTIETTAPIDISFEQGQMVGDAWDALEATGSMDIILTPIYDPINRPGYLAELSIYTQAGSDQYGAVMSWDKFPGNLTSIERAKDGTKRANTAVFFTSGGFAGSTETDSGSIAKVGQWWATQSWPGQISTTAVNALASLQVLLRKNGQETVTVVPSAEESPEPITDYKEGDRVPLNASKRLRKPLSGLSRVWGYTISPTDDGDEVVSELVLSADGTS